MTEALELPENLFAEDAQSDLRRRRHLKRVLIALLAFSPVVLVVGAWLALRSAAGSKLRSALATADRLDPGWRLAELESKRAVVPDTENSAPRVRAAFAMIPRDWLKPMPRGAKGNAKGPPRGNALFESFGSIDPAVQFDDDQVAGLRAELADLAGAAAEARGLADLPRGRYPITYAPNFFGTLLPHAQEARQVARLLQLDAMFRAQEGDTDGALDSCRALMNVGRSLGDEPIAISQLVRMAIEGVSLQALQRTLAQGQASDEALAKVQDLLADETAQPLLLHALRGERAGSDQLFRKLGTGELSLGELGNPREPTGSIPTYFNPSAWIEYNRGLNLDFMTRAVEIAKRPTNEQPDLWDRWGEETKSPKDYIGMVTGTLAHLLLPPSQALGHSYLRTRAELNSVWLMIAVERYRLAYGSWPDPKTSADALHPPPDPWIDGPVRFSRIEGGWAVYSIGPDRVDNGGTFHPRRRTDPGTDVGYRLWDVDHRRQPPAPQAAAEGP